MGKVNYTTPEINTRLAKLDTLEATVSGLSSTSRARGEEIAQLITNVDGLRELVGDFADSETNSAQHKELTDAITKLRTDLETAQRNIAECADARATADALKAVNDSLSNMLERIGNAENAQTATAGTLADVSKRLEQSISDWNDLAKTFADSEDTERAITEARRALFDDLWLAAVGEWGAVDHTHTNEDGTKSPYYLNELWLTFDEAQAVYAAGAIDNTDLTLRYYGAKIRTNLPPRCGSWAFGSTATNFTMQSTFDKSEIEIINLKTLQYEFCVYDRNSIGICAFGSMPKVKKIIGAIDMGCYSVPRDRGSYLFGDCTELQDVELHNVRYNLYLGNCPKISAKSIKTIIVNSINWGNPITITLHPLAYAKLTAADAAGDNAGEVVKDSEWSGLIELAADKNITFASA